MKKRKDGLYQKKITLNGKTKHIYGKTQREVTEKIMNLKNEQLSENHNFLTIAKKMLEQKKLTIGYKTLECYNNALNKLEPLYKMDIENITVNDIQQVINNNYACGLAKSSLVKIKILYGLICDFALSNNINAVNYSKLIKIPKNAAVKKRHGLSDDEIKIIENNVNSEFGLYAYIMLYTGLRRGEMLALTWGDIDIENRIININKSVEFIGNQPNIKLPKSQSGIRTVPILDNLIPYLKNPGSGDELVFGNNGKPLTKTVILKKWNKYCEVSGLTCTQHQLRHTYATILYRAGVDPKTAQSLLGHADIQTTMNIYTDISKDMQEKAANKLNEFLSEL